MYHSITFGDGALYPAGHEKEGQFMGVNTWEDWHLIPSSRPVVASPSIVTNFIAIPGRHGSIDMTEYLAGKPIFSDRSGSFEFYVDNDHEYWETIRMKIINYLHGKRMKMCLEDDPNYFWEGRFILKEWKSEPNYSKVAIDYTVGPFKTAISEQYASTKWNPFNFETDYAYEYALETAVLTSENPSISRNVLVTKAPFTLKVAFAENNQNDSASVSFGGKTATVNSAAPTAEFETTLIGPQLLTAEGLGTLSFSYMERSL